MGQYSLSIIQETMATRVLFTFSTASHAPKTAFKHWTTKGSQPGVLDEKQIEL